MGITPISVKKYESTNENDTTQEESGKRPRDEREMEREREKMEEGNERKAACSTTYIMPYSEFDK